MVTKVLGMKIGNLWELVKLVSFMTNTFASKWGKTCGRQLTPVIPLYWIIFAAISRANAIFIMTSEQNTVNTEFLSWKNLGNYSVCRMRLLTGDPWKWSFEMQWTLKAPQTHLLRRYCAFSVFRTLYLQKKNMKEPKNCTIFSCLQCFLDFVDMKKPGPKVSKSK